MDWDVGHGLCIPAWVHHKGGYPILAFQCVTDFNRRILAVYGPQFGTRNDKEIVKDDPNVHYVQTGWCNDFLWRYYTADGRVEQD
jgi:hypothetical protein